MVNRNSDPNNYYLVARSLNINRKEKIMNQIIYLVGLIVIIMAILSFIGLA